jgi:hypothetical protein
MKKRAGSNMAGQVTGQIGIYDETASSDAGMGSSPDNPQMFGR